MTAVLRLSSSQPIRLVTPLAGPAVAKDQASLRGQVNRRRNGVQIVERTMAAERGGVVMRGNAFGVRQVNRAVRLVEECTRGRVTRARFIVRCAVLKNVRVARRSV